MSDPLKKVTRGQLLSDLIRNGEGPFNADWFNLCIDAIKDYLDRRRTLYAGEPAANEIDDEIFLANVSWIDLDESAICGLGSWTNPPADDDASMQIFRGETNLYSADPAASSPFAVTLEPIPAGQRYACLTGNTGDRPPSANWQAIVGGKVIWNSTQPFVAGNVTVSGGNLYLCILAHTNHVPPNATYWQLLNDRGPYIDGMTVVAGDLVVLPFLGRAMLMGLTKCKINFSNAGHKYAAPEAGDYFRLVSQAAAGPAFVVQKQSGTGELWALVLLDPNNSAGGGGGGGITSINADTTAAQLITSADASVTITQPVPGTTNLSVVGLPGIEMTGGATIPFPGSPATVDGVLLNLTSGGTGRFNFGRSGGVQVYHLQYDSTDVNGNVTEVDLDFIAPVGNGSGVITSHGLFKISANITHGLSTVADTQISFAINNGTFDFVGVWGTDPLGNTISGGLVTRITPSGVSSTVTLAKITGGGANGSLTFVDGVITAFVPPT